MTTNMNNAQTTLSQLSLYEKAQIVKAILEDMNVNYSNYETCFDQAIEDMEDVMMYATEEGDV